MLCPPDESVQRNVTVAESFLNAVVESYTGEKK